jgi:hypothetical protein
MEINRVLLQEDRPVRTIEHVLPEYSTAGLRGTFYW